MATTTTTKNYKIKNTNKIFFLINSHQNIKLETKFLQLNQKKSKKKTKLNFKQITFER